MESGLYRPDIIFHLAAQALVLDSYKDPHGTFEANVTGTLKCTGSDPEKSFRKSCCDGDQ